MLIGFIVLTFCYLYISIDLRKRVERMESIMKQWMDVVHQKVEENDKQGGGEG